MSCDHYRAEPVDLLLDPHERVAWVCPDCWEQLPADWAPTARVEALLAEYRVAEDRAASLRVIAGPGAMDSGIGRKLTAAMASIRGEIAHLTKGAP
jgi:hypothetical protein